MGNNRQLFWGQGLFLSPQHLQQQDFFHQTQLQQLSQNLQAFGWGVKSLRIREDGLAAFTLEILQCEIVTRDRLLLRAGSLTDDRNAKVTARKFDKLLDATSGPLSVYIGIPRYQGGQNNLSSETTFAPNVVSPRYGVAGQEMADHFDIDAPKTEVAFIEYNLAIIFDRDELFATADRFYEMIKIAELIPAANGSGARLSPHYIPPCVSINSSAILLERIKGVRDLLLSKSQEFSAIKRQRGVRATASGTQDTLRVVMLQTLNRQIPFLQHCVEHGAAHPEMLYVALRQMVGELSVFSEEISVLGAELGTESESDLPAYDHEALSLCFDLVISRISGLVRALTVGAEAGIRLIYDGTYFKAPLAPAVFEGERGRYYLMIDSTKSGQELWELLQRTGKISSIEDMPRLRQSALFGLKISYLPVAPEELPQRGNFSYFNIDTQSPHWKRIQDAGNIALLCNIEPDETVIKLVVVREE